MEAPEKIYVHVRKDKVTNTWNSTWVGVHDIEYVRTDAFIEKAEYFIYSALNDGIMGTVNIEDFMRLFKKYMKGGEE